MMRPSTVSRAAPTANPEKGTTARALASRAAAIRASVATSLARVRPKPDCARDSFASAPARRVLFARGLPCAGRFALAEALGCRLFATRSSEAANDALQKAHERGGDAGCRRHHLGVIERLRQYAGSHVG